MIYQEKLKPPSDSGGQKIAGLEEARFARFSKLEPQTDYKIIKQLNENLKSDITLDEAFIFINPEHGDEGRLVEAPHWRTITTPAKSEYTEKSGKKHFYYVVNTKGCGYTKPTIDKSEYPLNEYDEWHRTNEYGALGAFGLLQIEGLNQQMDIIEKTKWLTANGLRTELYWATAKLKNIYFKGKKTSIKKLKELNVIPSHDIDGSQYVPIMGIRLLKTNTRVEELYQSNIERTKQLFEQAFETFNQETTDQNLDYPILKFNDPQSEKIFIKAFFERMGKNLAVLQNLGIIAWGLHSSNVTMAAEIVDVGDYFTWQYYTSYPEYVKKYNGIRRGTLKDIRDIAYSLRYLLMAINKIGGAKQDRPYLVQTFMEAFSQHLDNESLRQQQIKREDIFNATKKIMEAVLIKKINLKALKHNKEDGTPWDINDWNLGFSPDH